MKSNEIMVSVRCLAYNHEKYIRDMIEGCLKQKTNFKFEVIIHDDASTDKTADIIAEYAKKYPDIIIPIYERENQYKKMDGSILKKMHSIMRGKYVAICEGDDYWTDENKLQLQVDYLENHPECSFCFHNANIVWENGKNKCDFFPEKGFKQRIWKPEDSIYKTEDIIVLGFIPTASIVARKEFDLNRRSFCEKPVCGDLPLRLSMTLDGYGYYFDRKMSSYRTGNVYSEAGISRKNRSNSEKVYLGHCNILEGFDFYTNHIYHEVIQYDIKRRRVRLLMNELDLKTIRNEGLWDFYKTEVNLKIKCMIFFKIHCSGIVKIAKKLRNKIYGIKT